MAAKKKKATAYKDPVFCWRTESSKPRGGQIIAYETRLEEDGLIRCNCPGWIFFKGKPEEKTCRHKKMYMEEAPEILRMFKNGEELPLLNPEGSTTPTAASAPTPTTGHKPAKPTNIKYGRRIVLDF